MDIDISVTVHKHQMKDNGRIKYEILGSSILNM